jgi:transposase
MGAALNDSPQIDGRTMGSDRAFDTRQAQVILGAPGATNRLVVDAIIWMTRTGTPWRDLPPFFGKWNSVWKRFRRWAKAGVWERIMAALAEDPDFEARSVMSSSFSSTKLSTSGALPLATTKQSPPHHSSPWPASWF